MNFDGLSAIGSGIDDVFFLIGLAILGIEILKTVFSGAHRWRKLADGLANISTQIPFLLVEIFVFSSAYVIYTILSAQFVSWTLPLTGPVIILAVLAADLTYYWEHRISHEVRFFWIHHAVHHSSRHMNITTGVRFGPLEGMITILAGLPMILAGFSPELVIFGNLVVLAYQTWIHTELIGKLGPLEWVLNTPSHHRVHHGSDKKYLDMNYGGILIIWDRMFGTFQVEEETPRYGLKRDFDSVNPLRVWFSEFPQYWRDITSARSFSTFWNYAFGRPGWTPQDNATVE